MKNFITEISRDEVQKILKKKPVWISRSSIFVSLMVICIILFISFYIKYPVVISSRFKVISASETGTVSGKIFVSKNIFDNIKPGQELKINMDRYNFKEFGFLTGVIESVSSGTENSESADLNVFILNNFETNKGKQAEIKSEMEGNIEITTDKVPLIKRLLKSIKIIPSVFRSLI